MNESVTRTGAPTEWGWRVEFLGNQLDLVGGSRHLARSKSGRRMNSGIHHSNCGAKGGTDLFRCVSETPSLPRAALQPDSLMDLGTGMTRRLPRPLRLSSGRRGDFFGRLFCGTGAPFGGLRSGGSLFFDSH
jgi:hypothetical protein